MSGADDTYSLFLVPSASYAIKGEAALLRAGIHCRLIPVPRTLSSQCGVCLRTAINDRPSALEVLREAGVQISSVHDTAPHADTLSKRKETTDEQTTAEQ